MHTVEPLKFVGANFRGLLKLYMFGGTSFRVFSANTVSKRKYDFNPTLLIC